MIKYEQEICEYLRIPSIPKKEWNKKDSFKNGVAVIVTMGGQEAYAVASYDATRYTSGVADIVKVFGGEPFTCIKKVFVVPSYMDNMDAKDMDLDDESKKRAEELAKEAEVIEKEGVEDDAPAMPENEYFFDHIHNDEEGRAYIEAYNKANHLRAGLPKKHETIVMRLGVIWAEQNKK